MTKTFTTGHTRSRFWMNIRATVCFAKRANSGLQYPQSYVVHMFFFAFPVSELKSDRQDRLSNVSHAFSSVKTDFCQIVQAACKPDPDVYAIFLTCDLPVRFNSDPKLSACHFYMWEVFGHEFQSWQCEASSPVPQLGSKWKYIEVIRYWIETVKLDGNSCLFSLFTFK